MSPRSSARAVASFVLGWPLIVRVAIIALVAMVVAVRVVAHLS